MRIRPLTIILHVLPWVGLLLIPFAFHSRDESAAGLGALPASYFMLTNMVNMGLFYFNALYFFPRFCNARRWFIYLPGIVMVIVGLFYGKLALMSAIFPDVHADTQVERMQIWSSLFALLLSIVYRLGFDAVKRQQELKERDAEKLASELQFLRARISPHFFFNVLNNLVAMARAKSDRLEGSLLRLSDLMRYVLYEASGDRVPVEREIEYLKSYIELQKMRFEDIRISVNIHNGSPQHTIEPLLLIPFVENAFKHGTGSINDPFIDIRLSVENFRLRLDISNSVGNPGSDRNSGIGLKNAQRRLRLAYPERHELSIREERDIFRVNLILELQ